MANQPDRTLAFLGTGLTPILVVAGEDIRWKLDKLRVIANETVIDQELKSRLLAWITATASLNERRNQLMHSVYTFEPGKPQPTRFKASTRGGRWRGHAEPIESQSTELLASLLATGVDVANDLLESIHSGTLPSA